MPDVTIRMRPNGPLVIEGPFKLIDSRGAEFGGGVQRMQTKESGQVTVTVPVSTTPYVITATAAGHEPAHELVVPKSVDTPIDVPFHHYLNYHQKLQTFLPNEPNKVEAVVMWCLSTYNQYIPDLYGDLR